MGTIAAIENHLVAQLRALFGDRVREVESGPAQLSEGELERILRVAPAVYVAFLAGRREVGPGIKMVGSWGVYAVAANAAGEQARRHGDARTIGAYDLVELAAAQLDQHVVPDVGTAEVREITNLFSAAFVRHGRSVYAVVLDLPMTLPAGVDPSTLADFATFHANWDVPAHGNVDPPLPADADADATDNVTLETV